MLSQAGRAIAAARLPDEWTLRRHGISASTDADQCVLDTTVGPNGGDQTSFAGVARALNSPSLAGPVTLGALWAANPDLKDAEIRIEGETWPRALELPIAPQALPPPPLSSEQDPNQARISTGGHVAFNIELRGRTAGEVSEELGLYPSLADAYVLHEGKRVELADGDPVEVQDYDGTPRIQIATGGPEQATLVEFWDRQRAMASYVEVDRSQPPAFGTPHLTGWALPALGDGDSPWPLMLWWALLYGLSILARYEPAAWTSVLDLEQSKLAVGLEQVLNVAEERIPERVWWELKGV